MLFRSTLNILRFPSFQSPLVLSDKLRNYYRDCLKYWLEIHRQFSDEFLHEHERNHTQRLIDYLDVVKTPHREAFDLPKLRADFKHFYQQYDQRRGKNFAETFQGLKMFGISDPKNNLVDWYRSL